MLLPFLVGGVLIIIYRERLANALTASSRAFYANLLGEDRARRLEWLNNEVWSRWFLLFFGVAWIALSLLALVGPLVGLGEWEGL